MADPASVSVLIPACNEAGAIAGVVQAMRAAGNEVELRLYPRQGHVGLLLALAEPFRRVFRVLDDTLEFLDRAFG